MKKLQTIIAIISVLIVAVAVVLTAKYCGRAEEETTTTETTTETTEISTTEPITEVLTEKTTTDTTTEKAVETEYKPHTEPHTLDNGYVSPAFFREQGIIYGNGYKYTWYSEKVLPGGGLNIPGRWSDGNYVRDEDGYIVMAHETLPMGTVIDSPFGEGKIYDRCPTPGVVDVYVSF